MSIYKTVAMLRAMNPNQGEVTNNFLLDTLFQTVELSATETVEIDIIKGDERLAPFCTPIVGGKLMEEQGFKTNVYTPAYVKPMFTITAANAITDRVAGESPYSESSPAQRASIRLAKMLSDGEMQINRREEWMAAQGIVTGKVNIIGEGVNREIDFGMNPAHLITLSGTSEWSDAGSKPLDDMSSWSTLISDNGNANADIIIGGKDAIQALFAHESVTKVLDNRRITMGLIEPKLLAKGVVYYGTIISNGVNVEVYQYTGSYVDDAGVRQRFIPDGHIVMTSTTADFRRNFGAIADFDAGLASIPIFPKYWTKDDPSARFVLLKSAPLPAPHQIDAIVSVQVVS